MSNLTRSRKGSFVQLTAMDIINKKKVVLGFHDKEENKKKLAFWKQLW